MKRSFWKSDYNVCHNLEIDLRNFQKIKIETYFRSSLILPFLVGNILHVHTGKKYIPLLITESMVAHKLGEFVHTRGTFTYKKKGKRVRKKKGQ